MNTTLIFQSLSELPLVDFIQGEGHRSETEKSGCPLSEQGGIGLPLASNPALHRFSGPGRWQFNQLPRHCPGAE